MSARSISLIYVSFKASLNASNYFFFSWLMLFKIWCPIKRFLWLCSSSSNKMYSAFKTVTMISQRFNSLYIYWQFRGSLKMTASATNGRSVSKNRHTRFILLIFIYVPINLPSNLQCTAQWYVMAWKIWRHINEMINQVTFVTPFKSLSLSYLQRLSEIWSFRSVVTKLWKRMTLNSNRIVVYKTRSKLWVNYIVLSKSSLVLFLIT